MTTDPRIMEFMDKHYVWVVSSSVIGVFAAISRASSYGARVLLAGLRRFPRLHRAFYDCRAKCAENKRRFEATKAP
jgi:hypothetical protein